jgi:hypothetical protein
MSFVVNMEAMIDRLAFHVGHEAGYVNDGHADPLNPVSP